MRFNIFLVALVFIVSLPASATQPTNDELMKTCGKKTIVFNKHGDRVGEKLDGFCSGYLLATLHALANSKVSECHNSEAKEAEYLFSVYQAYFIEKKIASTEGASSTLLNAYRRAFDCK